MTRNLAMVGMLGAAVGGPYVVSQAPNWTGTAQPTSEASVEMTEAPPATFERPTAEAPNGPGSEVYRRPAPFEGRVQHSLDEVLRWEVTKDWVFRSWDRKSTGLADPKLFGVRVPVVTGQGMADVAGALSYYFDAQGRLQRIRLVGTTADTNSIVRLAMQRFGLQRRVSPSPGDQLYQLVENDRVRSQLRTRPESVLWGTSPHNSFRIDLELNRPGTVHWLRGPTPQLDIPNAPATTQQSVQAPADPDSVFPPRAVVPDESAANTAAAPNAASTSPSANGAEPSATPGAVTPDTDIAPLDSYRDRFRWPD